jgi:bifunctional UDP-N-acetylglucosamine pyrophosphorylase / glucosamine-1-phosphate N-acetyltransferase
VRYHAVHEALHTAVRLGCKGRAREEAMTEVACIVLAAGLGTRMKSDRAKVLHGAAGAACWATCWRRPPGCGRAASSSWWAPAWTRSRREARAAVPEAAIAVQQERRGTADAVAAARDEAAEAAATTLVLYGDVPLVRPETLERLVAAVDGGAKLAVLGFEADDPTGYGRLILDGAGRLGAIREELDATPEERAGRLCNSGLMAVDTALLWRLLPRIGEDNAKGERYLTDLAGLAAAEGLAAAVVRCPQTEVLGVNSRRDLAEVERHFQQRLREAAMAGGATLVAPETVFLCHDTRIGRDVTIEPNVTIGPNVSIADGATSAASAISKAPTSARARSSARSPG